MAARAKAAAVARRPKDSTVAAIDRIRKEREARRQSSEHYQRERRAEEKRNIREGKPGDVDFQRLISRFREDNAGKARKHVMPGHMRVCVAVRKRPVNEREKAMHDYDAVTAMNPKVAVHSCKMRVDGITKFLENQVFEFDHTFGDADDTAGVYHYTVQPLVALMFKRGGRGTCFAYGQTGSGKTYTMTGVQQLAARDIFRLLSSGEHSSKGLDVQVTMFEIYGGRCSDLLHDRAPITIREDGAGKVQTVGIKAVTCASEGELLAVVDAGNAARTTHATAVNEVSSRSHAMCEIMTVDRSGRVVGSLTLVDLAGSERAADSRSHNRQRRMESAEINKSLLALKECIRAMGGGSSHVPFRASKLTLALKDNFTAKGSRTVMIAAVSPAASSADHTQNTLRYAGRVKSKPEGRAAGPHSGLGGPVSTDLAFLQKPGGRGAKAASASSSSSSRRGAAPVRTSPVTVEGDEDDGSPGGRAAAAPAPRPARLGRGGDASSGRELRRPAPSAASGGGSVTPRGSAPSDARPRESRLTRDPDAPPSRLHVDRSRPRLAEAPAPAGRGASAASAGEDGKDADDEDEAFERGMRARRVGRAPSPAATGASASASSPDDADAGVADEFRSLRGGDGGAGAGGEKQDLAFLSRTLQAERGEAGGGGGEDGGAKWLEFHKIMDRIVEEEEALLAAHMSEIQENAHMLTEEGQLLSKVQGRDVVDYDIDGYASRLDALLRRKLATTKDLLARLTTFREHLQLEDEMARRGVGMGDDGAGVEWGDE